MSMSDMASPTAKPAYKLIFYCPTANLSKIQHAVFATGAGAWGGYSEVCFTSTGKGQFRPGPKSNPHIGQQSELEIVDETKCEVMIVGRETTIEAVKALKA